MEEEGAWLQHLKRVIAVIVGLLLGLVLAYLLVAITAGLRKGADVHIDAKAIAANPLEAPVLSAAQAPAKSATAIFYQRCARCHGEKGRGDGPLASLLTTPARDLVKGPFWLRSTPWGSAPNEDDLRRVIERGIPGTAMPGFEYAFKDLDADDEGHDVVEQLIMLLQKRSRYLRKPGKSVEVPEQASGEDWELEAGKAVYAALKCASCHGDDGHGGTKRAAELTDRRGRKLHVPDLTEPWDFRRGGQTEEIWQTLEFGFESKHMPSLVSKSSKGDRLALAAYVHSLGRAMLDPAEMRAARESRGLLAQGDNMVKLLSCQRCHTPRDARGLPVQSLAFAGGQTVTTASGVFVAPNLTPDPAQGIAKIDDAMLARAITTGESHDGRDIDPMAMPWTWYSMLTSSDIAAIIAHLRQLPARSFTPAEKAAADTGMPGRFSQLFGGDTWTVTSFAAASAEAKSDSVLSEENAPAKAKKNAADDEGAVPAAAADKPATAVKIEAATKDPPPEKNQPVTTKAAAQAESPQGIEALQARYDAASLKLKEAAAEYAASKAALEAARQAVKAVNESKNTRKVNKKHKKRRSRRRRRR